MIQAAVSYKLYYKCLKLSAYTNLNNCPYFTIFWKLLAKKLGGNPYWKVIIPNYVCMYVPTKLE